MTHLKVYMEGCTETLGLWPRHSAFVGEKIIPSCGSNPQLGLKSAALES